MMLVGADAATVGSPGTGSSLTVSVIRMANGEPE